MFDEKLKAQLDYYSQEGVMFETLANHLHEYDSNTRQGLVDQPISYQGVSALVRLSACVLIEQSYSEKLDDININSLLCLTQLVSDLYHIIDWDYFA